MISFLLTIKKNILDFDLLLIANIFTIILNMKQHSHQIYVFWIFI